MISIGITGGIGSGKSTVCRLFETLGAPVYYADDRARQLMTSDPELIHGLRKQFGDELFDENGELRRKWLADKVFRNPQQLAELNELVHPAVFRDAAAWMQSHLDRPYAIREAALLFESGSYRLVDEVVMVWAPESLRIQRVMSRDGLAESEVRDRMSRQWPDERKRAMAHHVIVNDGEYALIPQVMALHQGWMSRSGVNGENPASSTSRH